MYVEWREYTQKKIRKIARKFGTYFYNLTF